MQAKLVTNIGNASKPVNDIGFFVRCNTRLIGKAGTWRDTDEAKEERLWILAEPMGEKNFFRSKYRYRTVEWAPNRHRLKRLRKKIQGPRQLYWMYMRWDRTGKYIYPSEKHVIKRYRKYNGKVVKIYDTDTTRFIDSDYDYYKLHEDLEDMDRVIHNKEIPKEKRTEELLKNLYGDPTYPRTWRRKPDHAYD